MASELPGDVHELAPERFQDEVHSFEFWFQSVEGYLHGRPYGHLVDTPEAELDAGERDRLATVLCNYCVGEAAALDGASGLIAIAPNRNTRIFLATQAVDEARHLEVLSNRLRELGFPDTESECEKRAARSLLAFRRRLRELVGGKDWEASLFAQNVILEAMEFTTFQTHARRADPRTREVLEGIVKDERRHMGFGENELGRELQATPHVRARLGEIRRQLDPLILETFEETLSSLGMPRDERPTLGRDYLAVVARLGFES